MLSDKIYKEITRLSNLGESAFENGQHSMALDHYQQALDLVPNPKTDWEASTWLYTAIGDTHYFSRDYEKAKDSFFDAMNCPGGISNPFVNLRLGQSLYELGQKERSEDFLLKAYMIDGTKVFKGSQKKYLTYLKSKYSL